MKGEHWRIRTSPISLEYPLTRWWSMFGTIIAEIFVLLDPGTFVRYTFSYSKDGVTYIGIRAWFSYATKFRTLSQKYEVNEIKLRTNISAITVSTAVLHRDVKINPWHHLLKELRCRGFPVTSSFGRVAIKGFPVTSFGWVEGFSETKWGERLACREKTFRCGNDIMSSCPLDAY